MTNLDVIRNGGGSPQERSHRCGGDCPICNPHEHETCPICGCTLTDEEIENGICYGCMEDK